MPAMCDPCALDATPQICDATPAHLQGGALQQQSSLRLEPPAAGARAVAASSTPERTAVLWSDGTVAVYGVPGDKQPLLPLPTGDSREAVAQRRLAGFRLPAAGKQKSSGAAAGKKRGAAAADADAAAGSPSMAAVSDKQVALVGWATSSEGERWSSAGALCIACYTCCCRCCCIRMLAQMWCMHLCTLRCTNGPGRDDSVSIVDRDN